MMPNLAGSLRWLGLALIFASNASQAGEVPMPTGIECVRDCPGTSKPQRSSSSRRSSGGDMKAAIVGSIFEAILGAALAPPPDDNEEEQRRREKEAALAARQLAEQRAQAIAAQAAYDQMMKSYKQLEGAAAVGFKSLSSPSVGFKPLDGELETQAATARQPFDTPLAQAPSPVEGGTTPTPFFGDSMPMADIRLLVEPANDPRIVDLRKARKFVVESVKMPQDKRNEGKPIQTRPSHAECVSMQDKLNNYIDQQSKFHRTILLANDQVAIWEDANRNALINAAKEGVEHFAGLYLDALGKRGEAAERLAQALERNRARMLADGVNVAEIERKIARLKATTRFGKRAGVIADAKDWQGFMKDGMSAVLKQLTASNAEILEDPVMQRYFSTEMPEIQTMIDLTQMAASAKLFGKWVAKQMPVVAWTSYAINQTYNATDWVLSFQRLVEAHDINGKVYDATRSLQRRIDTTRIALKACR